MYQPSAPLDRATCTGLLATQMFGRLVFTHHALPDVLPAQYHLDGESLLIRLALGSPAAIASRDAIVAFEVDHFDPGSGTGWSVTIVGPAREMTAALPRAADDQVVNLRVPTDRITGHRLVVLPTDLPSHMS